MFAVTFWPIELMYLPVAKMHTWAKKEKKIAKLIPGTSRYDSFAKLRDTPKNT